MKKLRVALFLLSSILTLLFSVSSCEKSKEDIIPPPPVPNYNLTYLNGQDFFSLSLAARNSTLDTEITLALPSDLLVYNLNIDNYAGGLGQVRLIDSTREASESDSTNGPIPFSDLQLFSKHPNHLNVQLRDFSGTISVVITKKPPVGRQYDFPLNVGSQWTYAEYDSLTHRLDSLNLQIVKSVQIPFGPQQTTWRWRYRGTDQLLNVTLSNDTVIFDDIFPGAYDYTIPFIFPLRLGNQWGNMWYQLSVLEMDTLSVPAGTFQSAYKVDWWSNIPNQYYGATYWIQPQVGLVRKHDYGFGAGSVDVEWVLLSYSLSQ